jgi:hypothetical protein
LILNTKGTLLREDQRNNAITLNSKWKICNSELRDLANAIKHGEGKSLNRLKSAQPNLFKSGTNQIEVKVTDVERYTKALLDFWTDFFNAAIR